MNSRLMKDADFVRADLDSYPMYLNSAHIINCLKDQ